MWRVLKLFNVFVFAYLKVMCCLEHLQVEFTMLVCLKDGLENTGGLDDSLYFSSQHLLYFLRLLALSELVSIVPYWNLMCYLLFGLCMS